MRQNNECKLTETNQKAILEIIRLLKEQEEKKKINAAFEDPALFKLLGEHQAWANLGTAKSIQKKYEELLPHMNEQNNMHFPVQAIINTPVKKDADLMLEDYIAFYCGDPHNYDIPQPETDEQGNTFLRFRFPNQSEADNFLFQQAEKGRTFYFCDENNNVLAYSKGDGVLRNANGEEYKQGDTFKLTAPPVAYESFKAGRELQDSSSTLKV